MGSNPDTNPPSSKEMKFAFSKTALHAGIWTTGGYVVRQLLRLGSNLLLSRLLFPEAFGLMAIVNVVNQGLVMISDVGVTPAVIRSNRGDEHNYLNSAWTLQVVRGVAVWVIACLLSVPLARLYSQPQLTSLVPIGSLSAVIAGLRSTKWITEARVVRLGRRTVIEIVADLARILVMAVLAVVNPSVWALVAGALLGTTIQTIGSHLFLPGAVNRFAWDRGAITEMIRFGKWILVATFATYASGRGMRLIEGLLVDAATLGIISIAGLFAHAVSDLTRKITNQVLFPIYAMIRRDHSSSLSAKMLVGRRYLLAISMPLFGMLVLLGPWIVELLYDERYLRAGVFLSILAMDGALGAILQPYGSAFIACGDSRSHMNVLLVSAALEVGGVFVGYRLGGVIGMLAAQGCVRFLSYPATAVYARRHGLWHPLFDSLAFIIVIATGIVGLLVWS